MVHCLLSVVILTCSTEVPSLDPGDVSQHHGMHQSGDEGIAHPKQQFQGLQDNKPAVFDAAAYKVTF